MQQASTGGNVKSNNSDIDLSNNPYGLTSSDDDDDDNMDDQTLIANELTGTGNTAHFPKPLNAAATCCNCDSFLLDDDAVVAFTLEALLLLSTAADALVLPFLLVAADTIGPSLLFLSFVILAPPTALGRGVNWGILSLLFEALSSFPDVT